MPGTSSTGAEGVTPGTSGPGVWVWKMTWGTVTSVEIVVTVEPPVEQGTVAVVMYVMVVTGPVGAGGMTAAAVVSVGAVPVVTPAVGGVGGLLMSDGQLVMIPGLVGT